MLGSAGMGTRMKGRAKSRLKLTSKVGRLISKKLRSKKFRSGSPEK